MIIVISIIIQPCHNYFVMGFQKYGDSSKKIEVKDKQIEICCAWGDKLKDGILTYKIVNATSESEKLVTTALNDWQQNIKGLIFKKAASDEDVDILVTFRDDYGKVAGQTVTNFQNGFIFNTKILLAEKAYTKKLDDDIIEYIAKHEIGHALGLGHANFDKSLMSSLVYNSYNNITQCEIDALIEANKWKFIENSLPKISKIKKYEC